MAASLSPTDTSSFFRAQEQVRHGAAVGGPVRQAWPPERSRAGCARPCPQVQGLAVGREDEPGAHITDRFRVSRQPTDFPPRGGLPELDLAGLFVRFAGDAHRRDDCAVGAEGDAWDVTGQRERSQRLAGLGVVGLDRAPFVRYVISSLPPAVIPTR